MSQETFSFQTEVGRLLDIVAHSLYSHKEIFLRELISNASDACDRLRYAALTDPALIAEDSIFRIRLVVDRDARTLSIIDNGCGMNRDDLIETLGTIARSGTQAFVQQLTGDSKKDLALIGQFGVGFYSAFMVADHVDVITRKAGETTAWKWSSEGRGAFTIEEDQRDERGTSVILHVKADEDEFLEPMRLQSIVKKYSDHIGFPIIMGDGDDAETINNASSLWSLPKKDITQEQYTEFYHHVSHAFDDPWMILHHAIEGLVSYTCLLFVPSQPPYDLFDPLRKSRVRLYVKRVFITDECEGLMPSYLRFLRGVVDSEDLPLNISRETFQHDPRLAKIRSGMVKKVLDELTKRADEKPEDYTTFWENFGSVLKEGIYEDFENRDRLLGLSRFRSTTQEGFTSLEGYVQRMRPGQEVIYTLSGEAMETLANSPQLEGFRAKGIEVLLLTDPIDEFWIPSVGSYKDKKFVSAAGAEADLSKIEGAEAADAEKPKEPDAPAEEMAQLIAVMKDSLKGEVGDIRASQRLTESAVCLVAPEGGMDMYLERMLRQHRRLEANTIKPKVMEINPSHPLIRRLATLAGDNGENSVLLADAAHLLLDQARISEGEPISDARTFARRLATMMERALPAA